MNKLDMNILLMGLSSFGISLGIVELIMYRSMPFVVIPCMMLLGYLFWYGYDEYKRMKG